MKTTAGIIVSTLLTLALCGCGNNNNLSASAKNVSNKLAALTAAGEPTSLDQLDSYYPAVPESENAATIYAQAFDALTEFELGKPVNADTLARNQKAIVLLLQGAERKACRYPVNLAEGYATKLPHLQKIKAGAILLQAEALQQAQKGQSGAATKAIIGCAALTRSLQNEPILYSHLVELSCVDVTSKAIEQAFSVKAFTDPELQTIQESINSLEESISFRKALCTERAFVISTFQLPPDKFAQALTAPDQSTRQESSQSYYQTTTYYQDMDFALDYFSNAIAVCEMPFAASSSPRAQASSPRLDLAVQNGYRVSASLLSSRDFNQAARSAIARIRVTQAGIALERYRLQNRALPNSLEALVPQFIATVPTDPFNGKPLRYEKQSSSGYVIYSVGENLADDGGVEKAPKGKTPLDIVFAVSR